MHTTLFGPVRQWGFLVKDLDETMQHWVEKLGIGPWWGYRNVQLTSEFEGQTTEVVIDVGLAYQNGMQIELIHQKNDAPSPYRAFYDTPLRQQLVQFGYMVDDVPAAVTRGLQAGLRQQGLVRNPYASYVYLDSAAMDGMVVELMPAHAQLEAEFQRCAQEAAQWDGSNPYRLVQL